MIASQDFKRVMAQLAGAVAVITTCDERGQPWGFTATAFCSLSLKPPLVLFCLSEDADCYQAFIRGSAFAINLLSEQQRDLAQLFASKGQAKYQEITFRQGKLALPLLPQALVTLECSKQNTYPGGDHYIFTGLVEYGEQVVPTARPLLYYTQTYGTFTALSPIEEQVNLPGKKERSA